MMLVSYRTRGSDAAWHAGIAHEGTVVDVTASRLRRADEALGQGGGSLHRDASHPSNIKGGDVCQRHLRAMPSFGLRCTTSI